MTLHRIDFNYSEPNWDSLDMDFNPSLDYSEQKELALEQIKEELPEALDIEITNIRVAN